MVAHRPRPDCRRFEARPTLQTTAQRDRRRPTGRHDPHAGRSHQPAARVAEEPQRNAQQASGRSGVSMKNIVVIGAGIAGLAAACKLVEAGCSVTVLEASDRVGGRIRTVQANGVPVELGAEFVHGKPPELLGLIDDLGIETYELGGEMIHFSPDGSLHAETDEDVSSDDSPFPVMEQMAAWSEAHPGEDESFAEWLALTGNSAEGAASATGYVEGFNAADATAISVRSLAVQQHAEDEIDGDMSFHVSGGYQGLPDALVRRFEAAGGSLRRNSPVNEIVWQQGSVRVVLASGEVVHGDAALVTLPLGVLQAGTVQFTPPPGDVLQQAQHMRMGQVCRISLVFKRRWWADLPHVASETLQKLGFLIAAERVSGAHFNVFWSGFPSLDPVLTAWSGGPSSEAFDGLDDHAIAHIVCGDLARIFELTQEQVLGEMASHHRHNWASDPLALGAYSWVAVGGADASAEMTKPAENTLFFAGEHTDTSGHWGTVHGALRSGLRAAQQVMEAP
ncbi:MAG: flavin monoamine oxidase family protein [Janthinobacterium lividum]